MKRSTTVSRTKKSLLPSSSAPRSIYEDYFEYDRTYKSKYGDKTCVFLEVGSFFEIYTYKTISTNTIQHPLAQEISRICNLSLVEKKATYKNDDQQIMMMGFRNYMLDKYLQKMVDMDYTVVVYVQEKNGKDVTRSLDAVYSRGTFIRYDEDCDDVNEGISSQMRYMICIWIEVITKPVSNGRTKKATKLTNSVSAPVGSILYGISAINIFTGHSAIFEYETNYAMNPTTFDEMERFLSTFSPSEVIIISNTIDKPTINTILRFAGVQCNTIHVISKDDMVDTSYSDATLTKISNCEKQTYIQSILATYYDNINIYFQHDEFQRNQIATQSFCYLLDFIKEHNVNLIRKIAVPTFTNTSNRMVLANYTLRQLNIINDNSTEGSMGAGTLSSVLSFMNRCGTAIGRRLFQRKLLNPTFDTEWLESEYAKIANLMELSVEDRLLEIRKKITGIRDIEKIFRQIVSRKVYPSAIYQLYNSLDILDFLQAFFTELGVDKCFILPSSAAAAAADESVSLSDLLRNFKEFVNQTLNVDICRNTNTVQVFENNIIRPGISQEVDKLILKKTEYANDLNSVYFYFNELIRNSPTVKEKTQPTEYIKIHETDKSGVSLQITPTRAAILKKILAEKAAEGDGVLAISTGSSSTSKIFINIKDIRIVAASGSANEIQTPFFSTLSQNILKTEDNLNSEIAKAYIAFIQRIEVEWTNTIAQFIEYIGNMDVLITKAFIAKEYGYCRPITVSNEPKSFLQATKMRHCLIEHLQTNEIYVPNDVSLGVDGQDGILLFGTNAIGKTSFIRSIGICVILAQAGLYVPCESFVFSPYTALFSRIIGNDNLFKNLSTFQVEIGELAVILKQADDKSLILGDEICSSTEMESGLSIIMASLSEFHERRASFIFATHFHEIIHWEEMKRLENIKIKHLEVTFDPATGKLKYDRKLKDGAGITSYGLTVCQSMNLPTEFLDRAFHIRNRHYPENGGILSLSRSRYNSKKLVGICEDCRVEFSTEIHHIEHQKNADSTGMVRTKEGRVFHKNHPANLRSLCEDCHKKAHMFH